MRLQNFKFQSIFAILVGHSYSNKFMHKHSSYSWQLEHYLIMSSNNRNCENYMCDTPYNLKEESLYDHCRPPYLQDDQVAKGNCYVCA